ncbi:hypothetical protein [Haliscomenobacter sp.]|uniref:hypothetical protein n=1 Tax=Haliscomenobacter sp. TaxID=2717303 RepID=UPI0035933DC3
MIKAILVIVACISILQVVRFGWSRLAYNFFSLLLIFLIFGRIACEKVLCLWYLPKYLISLVFTKIKCPACAGYEPDWSLRGGIDEAGLHNPFKRIPQ